MATNDDPDFEPVHASSPIDHVLTELQLYGHRPFQDEPEEGQEPEGSSPQPQTAGDASDRDDKDSGSSAPETRSDNEIAKIGHVGAICRYTIAIAAKPVASTLTVNSRRRWARRCLAIVRL